MYVYIYIYIRMMQHIAPGGEPRLPGHPRRLGGRPVARGLHLRVRAYEVIINYQLLITNDNY